MPRSTQLQTTYVGIHGMVIVADTRSGAPTRLKLGIIELFLFTHVSYHLSSLV